MHSDKLSLLFNPSSIAIVGASERVGPGRQAIENLKKLGYKGEIFPVNPKYDYVLGLPCYHSLTDIKEQGKQVDTVAILLNRDMVIPVLEEAGSIGASAAWAFAGGFAEAGEEGATLQQKLTDVCTANDMVFLGPNCVGYLHPSVGSATFSAPAPRKFPPGNIGMVAQSGYLSLAVANSNRGLGFSLLCSTGNEAVVESTDCISYMLDDDATDVVLAFIEQFRNPDKLIEVGEKAREKEKPIILIKVGRSSMAQRATVAHTGALAGSYDVQRAMFEKLGIILVDDFDEMFETAELLSKTRKRRLEGNKIFAVTLSGGVISLIGDVSQDLNLCFPDWSEEGKKKLDGVLLEFSDITNPLDAWGRGNIRETYYTCLKATAEEPEADLVLVVQDVPGNMGPLQVDEYMAVAKAAVKVSTEVDKPVVMLSNQSSGFNFEIWETIRRANLPLLQGTKEGLTALDNLVTYSLRSKKPLPVHTIRENPQARALLPKEGGVLDEYRSKEILRAYGIPFVPEILCETLEQTISAANEIGYPVVLKVVSADIRHKTEAGVVALHCKTVTELTDAYRRILENAKSYDPDAIIRGVLCSKMVQESVAEAIVGVLHDPSFGPAVVFGLGGVLVEVLKDRSLGIPPLSREEARKMIDSTKGSALLYGFRGNPKADIEALIDMIVKTGDMTADLVSRIDALDINPLLVLPEGKGVVAVDALLSIRDE